MIKQIKRPIISNKEKERLILALLAVLLVTSWGLIGYLVYQNSGAKKNTVIPQATPKESTDTVNFTSIRNDYSFSYNKYEYNKSLSDEKATLAGPGSISFEVEVIETDVSTPEEWWKEQKTDTRFKLPVDDFIIEKTTISNQPAIKITLKPGKWQGPGITEELYLTIYDGKIYKFRLDPSSGKVPFSTFKFLE